nr:hypothetical protein [Streptomyces sp. SID5473]
MTARAYGDTTRLTLTASGAAPVVWSARTGVSWLQLSRSSGVLHPGESVTVLVTVVPDREPAGPWRAYLRVEPTGAVLRIDGRGAPEHSPDPGPHPTRPTRPGLPTGRPSSPGPDPSPTATASPTPTPTPSPTASEPQASPSPTPSPTDPDPGASPTDGAPPP